MRMHRSGVISTFVGVLEALGMLIINTVTDAENRFSINGCLCNISLSNRDVRLLFKPLFWGQENGFAL